MTKKAVKAEPAPKKRSLNAARRIRLLTFAASKFIAKKERAEEAKLRDRLLEIFLTFHAKEIVPALPTLRKFGAAKLVSAIELPYSRSITVEVKQIEAPGGKMIERETKESLQAPYEDHEFVFSTVVQLKDMMRGAYPNYGYGRKINNTLAFGKEIEVAASRFSQGNGYLKLDYDVLVLDADGDRTSFLPKKFYETLDRYYLAGRKRCETERHLHSTIAKIIDGATTFEDLLEFWPEAKEIEGELFTSEKLPNSVALVALSNEDKEFLCSNMRSRGVKALACAA